MLLKTFTFESIKAIYDMIIASTHFLKKNKNRVILIVVVVLSLLTVDGAESKQQNSQHDIFHSLLMLSVR